MLRYLICSELDNILSLCVCQYLLLQSGCDRQVEIWRTACCRADKTHQALVTKLHVGLCSIIIEICSPFCWWSTVEVWLLQCCLCDDRSGCKGKEFVIFLCTSFKLQAEKSAVTLNNYCHNISNLQTQTVRELLLSKHLTCEILWFSGRNSMAVKNTHGK